MENFDQPLKWPGVAFEMTDSQAQAVLRKINYQSFSETIK